MREGVLFGWLVGCVGLPLVVVFIIVVVVIVVVVIVVRSFVRSFVAGCRLQVAGARSRSL